MAAFSTNQVRHLYVANGTGAVTAASAAGTIAVKSNTVDSSIYFQYKGATDLMRSDIINIKNINSAKLTLASALATKLKQVTVTLKSDVNTGNPITGQDYILRINFRQYLATGDDNQHIKFGAVHAYQGMTPSDFYKTLALSLVGNFKKEVVPLLSFQLATATTPVSVTSATKSADLSGTYTGVIISEVEQPWTRGLFQQMPVQFEVNPTTVLLNGDEVIWGTTAIAAGASVPNGKKIADLEYFCMGERGDIYRNMGFPNVIPTTYLVDPTKEYHVLDISYYFAGPGEDVQKSQRSLSIVCADKTTMNALIAAFNTATGLTVDVIPA